MDSHAFRVIGNELIALLDGARLEKIHGPRPCVLAFTLFAGGEKRRLLFHFERQAPLLFLSGRRPDNPSHPSAAVMRLRKYYEGRRLGRGIIDYPARCLAFPVHAPLADTLPWLLLDMVNGAFALKELPENFGREPLWPDLALTDSLCAVPWQKGSMAGIWQDYTVLTPLLRETLAALEPLDGRALLVDLEAGGAGLFPYADRTGSPVLYAAWPLPSVLCERRSIFPYPEEKLLSLRDEAYPALTVSSLIDDPKFFAELGRAISKETGASLRRESKKQARLLARLDQEHRRLTAMLAQREDAEALRSVLWRHAADARLESVEVGGDGSGPARHIALNSLLSVRENMARMFKESSRGARGLAMLEVRRAQALMPDAEASRNAGRDSALADGAAGGEIRNVGRFRSSDGFILLRGKNAKGNQSLLKIGMPHDLWLHAEDGPSAHLIIRRSHAAEEIPERTLREAALLVAEKSWQRHDAKARIMVVLLRHVHAVKGAAPGTVKVDAVLRSMAVCLTESI